MAHDDLFASDAARETHKVSSYNSRPVKKQRFGGRDIPDPAADEPKEAAAHCDHRQAAAGKAAAGIVPWEAAAYAPMDAEAAHVAAHAVVAGVHVGRKASLVLRAVLHPVHVANEGKRRAQERMLEFATTLA
jgi:hypothetical protein